MQLTGSPAGRMIAEHLAYREGRRYRHRDAQGILWLPSDFADYTRGRSRQALRTNVRRARASGLTTAHATLDEWQPGAAEIRHGHITPGPVERVMVFGRNGEMVGDSILSVDARAALLHGTMSTVQDVRWLLNAAIIERLCGACELLLTNHAAMYRESYGSHHFQRLLGFDIARLRAAGPPSAPRAYLQPGAPPNRRAR